MADTILIAGLELRSRIGVTDEERSKAQRLTATLTLEPARDFRELGDRIENTVDYSKVCDAVKDIAASGERRLLETLAEEIASGLLEKFALSAVEVEVRKYVLPDTDFAGARIRRSR